jgi:lipid-A-disaccharide synthase
MKEEESRPVSGNVFIVAGEASADLHAAELVRELKASGARFHFFGVGGSELAREGMRIDVNAADLSIVGFTGWWEKLGGAYAGYKKLCRRIRAEKPDVAILLDLPDFNLMMARQLKKAGVPVIYYISPQVWAWRKYRIHKIKKYVDKMVVLFPFEKEFYEKHGVDVEFAGHPLVDMVPHRKTYRAAAEVEAAPRFALLPGSRKSEIRLHGPILKDVVAALRISYPDAQFRVPIASTVDPALVREYLGEQVELVAGNAYEVLSWADVAVVASGTATLETALIGTPFFLFYKFSSLNAFLFRYLVRYKHFVGMPNILLGREVAKELILDRATPKALFEECIHLIEEPAYRQSVTEDLLRCRLLLGESGASHRAARVVADFLSRTPKLSGGPTIELAPLPT